MTATATLPVLLPQNSLSHPQNFTHLEWTPRRYLSAPQPPPMDDAKLQEQEMANARQAMDGKTVKKTRPRRTVDYNGGLGRWALVRSGLFTESSLREIYWQMRKLRPNPTYIPYMRPSPPHIIDVKTSISLHGLFFLTFILPQLLPPKAYTDNPSTSLCTKFVHTSTNKIRCPVNVVTVRNSSLTEHRCTHWSNAVDTGRPSRAHGLDEWGIYPLEWPHLQLRDNPSST